MSPATPLEHEPSKDAPFSPTSRPVGANPTAAIVYSLGDALVKGAPGRSSARRGLDRRHVVVGEAEMVADLVHEDMGHDRAERVLALAPEVEQRAAIEPDHVGQRAGLLDCGTMRQAATAEQAEQVELAL